jgi:hypothetical protein
MIPITTRGCFEIQDSIKIAGGDFLSINCRKPYWFVYLQTILERPGKDITALE